MNLGLDPTERAHCATAHAALQAGRTLAVWSLGLDALAAAWLLAGATPGAAGAATAVLLLALAERVCAWRLRFDETLFGALAAGRIGTLAALDDGLQALGLRRAPATPRPLADRLAGTHRLVRTQGVLVLLQTLALAGAALAQVIPSGGP